MSATTLFTPGRAGRRRLAPRQRLGLGLLGGLLAIAWLTPWLHDADPARQQLTRILELPSLAAPLGTDHLGRDLLARSASALRLSLGMALLSVVSAAVPGILLAGRDPR